MDEVKSNMKMYLGVDGGGTKTKFLLCDAGGRALAEATLPTCHYMQVGFGDVTRVLSEGLEAVLRGASASPRQVSAAFIGLPGYDDIAADKPILERAVADAMGPVPHRVGNDCENSLAGALAGACGISLICGTGSIACGRNAAGEVMRSGGWHYAIGSDEGSGYWIGVELLRLFTRQSDGRDERTPLYEAIRSKLALGEDGEVITRVVDEWGMDRAKLASLSLLVGELYALGDPNAARILERGAAELTDMAFALYRRLGFSGEVPVSYSGGVFNLGAPILEPLERRLRALGMALVAPKLPPDKGAVLLAFQRDGAAIPEGLME